MNNAETFVVVIDSNEIDNHIFKRIIAKHYSHLSCKTFADIKEAYQFLFESEQYSMYDNKVIFVDLYTLLMDKWSFFKKISALPMEIRDNCKIYVISSSVDTHEIRQVKSYPFVEEYFIKPMHQNNLAEIFAVAV
jgi:response regulator of citrate/malate metabolism